MHDLRLKLLEICNGFTIIVLSVVIVIGALASISSSFHFRKQSVKELSLLSSKVKVSILQSCFCNNYPIFKGLAVINE